MGNYILILISILSSLSLFAEVGATIFVPFIYSNFSFYKKAVKESKVTKFSFKKILLLLSFILIGSFGVLINYTTSFIGQSFYGTKELILTPWFFNGVLNSILVVISSILLFTKFKAENLAELIISSLSVTIYSSLVIILSIGLLFEFPVLQKDFVYPKGYFRCVTQEPVVVKGFLVYKKLNFFIYEKVEDPGEVCLETEV
jgi:hypothetical protein